MKVISYKTSQPWGKLPAIIHTRMGSGLASPNRVTRTLAKYQRSVKALSQQWEGVHSGVPSLGSVRPANSSPLEGIVPLMQG